MIFKKWNEKLALFLISILILRNYFQLEDSDVELCDEIYEAYTDLLQERDEGDDTLCYKSYFLVRSPPPPFFFTFKLGY